MNKNLKLILDLLNMQNYKITKKTLRPFVGREGTEILYAWYKAIREKDNAKVEFGSKDVTHEEGDTCELELEVRDNGKGARWYEVV